MFRFKKLGYAALNVTDLERSTAYYRDLVGLQLNDQVPGESAWLSCSADHHNLVLYQADEPGLKRVAWEMENEQELARAFDHFTAQGLQPEQLDRETNQALRQADTIRLREPNTGLCLELYSSMQERGLPYQPTVAKIARLGHVVITTTKWQQTIDFFMNEMNFRVSDKIDGFIYFMRCFPNPYHHTFGVGNAAAVGRNEDLLHHVNFMVTDLDDIGRAVTRMRENDVPVVFGPGRHPPSGSVFFYYLDPDGMTTEYSFGMEEFPEEGARKPRLLEPRPDSIDYWGNVPEPGFACVGAIEQAP